MPQSAHRAISNPKVGKVLAFRYPLRSLGLTPMWAGNEQLEGDHRLLERFHALLLLLAKPQVPVRRRHLGLSASRSCLCCGWRLPPEKLPQVPSATSTKESGSRSTVCWPAQAWLDDAQS